MKFVPSKGGEPRADVRVTLCLTQKEVEFLQRRAKSQGRNGFHSAIVDAFWRGMGGWIEDV